MIDIIVILNENYYEWAECTSHLGNLEVEGYLYSSSINYNKNIVK